MILTDLFEGRMSDLDIEYQDWLHSRGRGAIGDREFERAYGITRREWAIRNSDWIMKKQARPQDPDAHLYPERQGYRPVKKETVHEIQDKVKYVLILDGKPVMIKTDLSKIERDAEFIRRHFPETQVDIKQVAEPNKAQLEENLRKWFKEKWVRFGPDGKIRGACARGSESEGKPKCLPQAKAHALGKKKRAAAAAKKRREDPNPERRGPAKNVATKVREQELDEIDRRGFLKGLGAAAVAGAAGSAMAAPFKHSQNVDPMTDKVQGGNSTVVSDDGSAKLYIQWNSGVWFDLNQGRVGVEDFKYGPTQTMRIKIGNSTVNVFGGVISKNFKSIQLGMDPAETKKLASKILKHSGELRLEVLLADGNKKVFKFTIEPDATSKSVKEQGVAEEQLDEKQDACYHKVKARYKVWPSAYASGALVQCRKKGAANWGKGSKKK